MKKTFFFFILTLLVISCSRDYEFDANASIIGVWKPIKATAIKNVAGFEVTKTEDFTICQQQSRMIYKADLTAVEIRYDEVNGNCEKTLERNFTYTYSPTTKNLVHTFSDGSIKEAKVVSITNDLLIVRGKKEIDGTMYDVEVTNTKLNN